MSTLRFNIRRISDHIRSESVTCGRSGLGFRFDNCRDGRKRLAVPCTGPQSTSSRPRGGGSGCGARATDPERGRVGRCEAHEHPFVGLASSRAGVGIRSGGCGSGLVAAGFAQRGLRARNMDDHGVWKLHWVRACPPRHVDLLKPRKETILPRVLRRGGRTLGGRMERRDGPSSKLTSDALCSNPGDVNDGLQPRPVFEHPCEHASHTTLEATQG